MKINFNQNLVFLSSNKNTVSKNNMNVIQKQRKYETVPIAYAKASISFSGGSIVKINQIERLGKKVQDLVEGNMIRIKDDFVIEPEERGNLDKVGNVLKLLEEKGSELLDILLSKDEEKRKIICNNYHIFYESTLTSLDKVKSGEKEYSKFWLENKKIGKTPIAEIFEKVLGTKINHENVNNLIKSSTKEQIQQVKEQSILTWFTTALNPKQANELSVLPVSNDIDFGLKGTFEKYKDNPLFRFLLQMKTKNNGNKETTDLEVENLLRELFNKESEFNKKFYEETEKMFFNQNSTEEERERAFDVMLAFLREQISIDNSNNLSTTMKKLGEFSVASQETGKKKNPIYGLRAAKPLFKLSKQYWNKIYLPSLMNTELQKLIYVEKAIEKTPALQSLKTFGNLQSDSKFFIAKYYHSQQFKEHIDDSMKIMLADRNILDKNQIIQDLMNQAHLDTNNFYSILETIPEYTKSEEGVKFLQEQTLTGKNSQDSTDLVTLCLQVVGKDALALSNNDKEKYEFLSKLPKEELDLAITKIKKEWLDVYLPAQIDRNVDFQAYKTSTDVQMIEELQKINECLGEVKIKLDSMTLSLGNVVSNLNLIYAKAKNPIAASIGLQTNAQLQLEDLRAALSKLSPEDNQIVLQQIKKDGLKYLEVLEKNTSDPSAKKELSSIKQTVITANNTPDILDRIGTYGTSMLISRGLYNGLPVVADSIVHHVNNAAEHVYNALTQVNPLSVDPSSSIDTIGHVVPGTVAVLGHAINHTAATTSSLASSAGGGVGGGAGGVAGPIEAIVLAAAAIGIHGIVKGIKLQKQHIPLYF